MNVLSKPSEQNVQQKYEFKLRQSRYLMIYLSLLTVGGVVALGELNLPLPVVSACVLGIFLYFGYSYWAWVSLKSPRSVHQVMYEGRDWSIRLSTGLILPVHLLKRSSYRTPYLMILKFKTDHQASFYSHYAVPIFADALPEKDFKKLYRLLKGR